MQERPHYGCSTILNVALVQQARGTSRQIAHFACLLGLSCNFIPAVYGNACEVATSGQEVEGLGDVIVCQILPEPSCALCAAC